MRFTATIAFAAIAPMLIAASQPVRLQPSSPWVLDYAADSCRLVRTFAEGKQKTVLAFESAAPGQMDLLVVGNGLKGYSEDYDGVPLRFLPVGGKPLHGRAAVSAESGAPAILWPTVRLLPDVLVDKLERQEAEADRRSKAAMRPEALDPGQKELVKAARQDFASHANEVQIGGRRAVILETGPLGKPIKMFDQCGRDSLRDWGVNPDLEDKIVKPVWAPHPDRWFGPEDYPSDMVTSGQESEVEVRLLVDASGRPTKCTSLSHFKEKEFDEVVCDKFMKRARFEPAELADGTKVPSYYVQRVIFQMRR
jgi:hypothetical protein